MARSHYVALLRGINVGGNNLIKMGALKAAFEALGLEAVATYIASGNVLFETGAADRGALTSRIERALSKEFRYASTIVLRSRQELEAVVTRAPRGFGSAPEKFRYDVVFVKEPLAAAEAMKSVPLKEGVDEAFAGKGVIYFSRLISRASQSRLSRIVGLPVYQSMTIRNWNTTTRLVELLRERTTGT